MSSQQILMLQRHLEYSFSQLIDKDFFCDGHNFSSKEVACAVFNFINSTKIALSYAFFDGVIANNLSL
jgi:hypothetical protein